MRELIKRELKYPAEALKARIEGTVYLRYNIDYQGHVTSSKILSGIGHGCDEEAQRIVTKFKFQVPKAPQKLKIKFHKTIKIHFRLPKEKPQEAITANPPSKSAVRVNYTVTKTKKKEKNQESNQKSKGYTYTIKF